MTDKNEIDWEAMIASPEQIKMDLKQVEIGGSHVITISEVRQIENSLIAQVNSETLAGDFIWLRGDLGPQNGFLSLVKAAEGGENIAGSTFEYQKVESEKSPVGYAHRWIKQ